MIYCNDKFKLKIKVTRRRPLDFKFPLKAIVTRRRPLDFKFPLKLKIAYATNDWCPDFKLRLKIRQPGYFDTLFKPSSINGVPVIPSRSEKKSFTTIRVFLQLPDSGQEIYIGSGSPSEIGFDWGMNQEILWNMRLINFDKTFLDPYQEWYTSLQEDIYDPINQRRKFIKFEICSWVGNKKQYFILPRLVIKENPDCDEFLTLSGWDEITETITQKINLPSFCGQKALTRIANEDGTPSDTQFYVYSLTNSNYIEELYVNYQRVYGGWSYDATTKIVTFSTAVNQKYVVFVRNRISKQEAIKSICNQCVDKFPEYMTKEYFDVRFINLPDSYFTSTLSTFNTIPRDTIKKLIASMPADYRITPIGNKLSLQFFPKVLGNEYPRPKIHLHQSLFRGKPQIKKSAIRAYTEGDLRRYSEIYDAYEAIKVTKAVN